MDRLVAETEVASDQLLLDAVNDNPNLPVPKEVQKRLDVIRSNQDG